MTVPETAVHKDYGAPPRENEVRLSWKIFSVEPEAVSKAMDHAPDD